MNNNYIVCSTVRSGSTLLCKTLERLGGFGHPEEFFHCHTLRKLKLDNHPDDFLNYCQFIRKESADRFGIKMHWWQLFDFLRLARQSSQFREREDLEILNMLFPDLRFIYLWRRDVISQAVSAAIASQTNQWEKTSRAQKPATIKFQPWKIYEWEQSLKDQNQCWKTFFQENHLHYYEITYEDLVESFTKETTNVINHIDGELGGEQRWEAPQLEMPIQRQSNSTNKTFISYYSRLPKPLVGASYQLYRQLKLVKERVG